jgi:hypothetical protein
MFRFVTTLLAAIAVLALSGRASAQAVPHFAKGGAQFINQNDFVGSGRATHLGAYTEVGNVTFTPTRNPVVLAVNGWATYTAANGDELRALLRGELNTSTGVVTATVTYVRGTDRFVSASGSSTLAGQVLGGGAIRVTVAGSLDF